MVWYLYLSEAPLSHLATAWRLTPRRPATISWDMPLAFLCSRMRSPSVIVLTSSPIIRDSATGGCSGGEMPAFAGNLAKFPAFWYDNVC